MIDVQTYLSGLLEEATGIDALAGDILPQLNTRNMSAFLWAGLKAGGLSMSLDEFRKKLPVGILKAYHTLIRVGIDRASTPGEKKSEDEAPPQPESPSEPTGSSSGPLESTTSDSPPSSSGD